MTKLLNKYEINWKWIEYKLIHEPKQTFVDVPHNSSIIDRPRNHKVSISCPADVIHVFYVTPTDKVRTPNYC